MPKYVINLRNGVLHRKPTREQCNMDQVRDKKNLSVAPLGRRCGHCFK